MKCQILFWGWSGGVKMLCILHYLTVQLILAYSWARPAILVAGKGRGGMFLFLLFPHFHSCSCFFPVPRFHLLCYLSISFLPFSGRWHEMTHKDRSVVKPQHVFWEKIRKIFQSVVCWKFYLAYEELISKWNINIRFSLFFYHCRWYPNFMHM